LRVVLQKIVNKIETTNNNSNSHFFHNQRARFGNSRIFKTIV